MSCEVEDEGPRASGETGGIAWLFSLGILKTSAGREVWSDGGKDFYRSDGFVWVI